MTPSLRAAQKELTRSLLLDAGLRVFQAKGYPSTTVDDIATAAGTTRVTFYAYFPTRSALMRSLVDERLNGRLERIRTGEGPSTAESLVTAVRTGTRDSLHDWLRQTADGWPEIRPMLRMATTAAACDPELADLMEVWMAEAAADVEAGLAQGGRVAPHLRRLRGRLAMEALNLVAQNWDREDWGLTRDQAIEELTVVWSDLLEAAA